LKITINSQCKMLYIIKILFQNLKLNKNLCFAVLLNIILVTPVIAQKGNQVDHLFLQSGKEFVRVKFKALSGNAAGKVYYVRLLRTKK